MNFFKFRFFSAFFWLSSDVRNHETWLKWLLMLLFFLQLLWSSIVDRFLILDDDCWLSREAKLYLKWNLIYGNWIISYFNLDKCWLFTVRWSYTILCLRLRTLLAFGSVQCFPVSRRQRSSWWGWHWFHRSSWMLRSTKICWMVEGENWHCRRWHFLFV